ncbi:hypothetical protein D5H75_15765 [Bailinhaonella thermotolerans]|uniref:Uncharacterized protein n=1 Tax=Bailinhaonella thermotolerans TaxID=1070861 RepID=A0A3A4ARW5_9ACTN|nr:hypothetical protein D5H75_15765 [Bailinhaonella thermotolerans]
MLFELAPKASSSTRMTASSTGDQLDGHRDDGGAVHGERDEHHGLVVFAAMEAELAHAAEFRVLSSRTFLVVWLCLLGVLACPGSGVSRSTFG